MNDLTQYYENVDNVTISWQRLMSLLDSIRRLEQSDYELRMYVNELEEFKKKCEKEGKA